MMSVNGSALEKAVENYRPMLLRLACGCTGNFSDSEDIVEDVFVKLYLRHGDFPREEDMRAWLIRVTVNMCRSHVRSWRIGKRSELPEDMPGTENFPEKTALKELLLKLKPAYRAVIYMHYYEGLSAAEIGRILKISVTAVTTRLQRGRETLREMLDD